MQPTHPPLKRVTVEYADGSTMSWNIDPDRDWSVDVDREIRRHDISPSEFAQFEALPSGSLLIRAKYRTTPMAG